MCDYCAINKNGEADFSFHIIEAQELRNREERLRVGIVRKKSKDGKPCSNTLSIWVAPRGAYMKNEVLCDVQLDIKFCPFCGEKL